MALTIDQAFIKQFESEGPYLSEQALTDNLQSNMDNLGTNL